MAYWSFPLPCADGISPGLQDYPRSGRAAFGTLADAKDHGVCGESLKSLDTPFGIMITNLFDPIPSFSDISKAIAQNQYFTYNFLH